MASLPTDHLSPSDAAVAVRSFPRRFRGVLARPDETGDTDDGQQADPDELARRVGPDGRSAADHLLAADGVLALLDRALEQVRSDDDPVLHPAVADLRGSWWDDEHTPLPALLDQLEHTAERCADRIDVVATDDWGRQVRVADADATVGVLDVVREAVDVVAGHLRSAERTITAVR
ncbi:MAG TPA: hypothetical protein DCS55_19610 [Acidimicrobiaceae bacterium]|nr:hypothetical protein [Acidimicrobiaceae bacterium]